MKCATIHLYINSSEPFQSVIIKIISVVFSPVV